ERSRMGHCISLGPSSDPEPMVQRRRATRTGEERSLRYRNKSEAGALLRQDGPVPGRYRMSDQRGDWLVVIFSGGAGGDAIHSIRCNHESTATEIISWFKQFNVQVMY